MNKLVPANDLLIYFDGSDTVAVVSKSKRKFRVKKSYLDRISEWSSSRSNKELDQVDLDLVKNGILTRKSDYYEWEGDRESLFAHFNIKDYSNPPEEIIGKDSIKYKSLEFAKDKIVPEKFRHPNCLGIVELPPSSMNDIPDISLRDVLQSRMTCRDFRGKSCSIEELSTLLHANFQWENKAGLDNLSKNNLSPLNAVFRTAPSATGLQMHEVFVGILNVENTENGIYHYRLESNKQILQRVSNDFSDDILIKATRGQDWAKGLSFVIFLVSDMKKMWVKTRTAKGYGVAYLEAGHISQNVQLVSSALGLNTWITGSFFDKILEKILVIDNFNHLFCPFLVGVGYSHPSRVAEVFC